MPGVTRVGDKCTGHDGYEPKPLIEGSKTFKVDGRFVGLVGCHYEEHSKPNADTHQDYIAEGAPSVFIEGKPVARIGDKVSNGGTVAEGSTTFIIGNKGGQDYGISIGYPIAHQLTKALYKLTPIDEVILELPAIAENEAKTDCDNENDKLGWMELAQMLRFWLMGNEYKITATDIDNGTAPIYILRLDWDWCMSYARFSISVNTLKLDALSHNGKQELIKNLKKLKIWNTGGDFDFSEYQPKDWEKYYFNYITVPAMELPYADGMVACLAAHSIKVLASGSVDVNQDGSRTISVKALFFYVHDIFQFEDANDNLRYWSRKLLDYCSYEWQEKDDSYVNLWNSNLNDFRSKYRKGRDFLVLSKLHRDELYVPEVFLSN